MNKDLFEILKYEFFNKSKKLDTDVDLVSTNLYSYITESFMLYRWINGLFINRIKFLTDLENDENILFMERLLCGISYVKCPQNLETIKRLKKNIIDNKQIKLNKRLNENLEAKANGKEYMEKKRNILRLIDETKDYYNGLSEKVYELNDLINQIKDLVLQDVSLYSDYLKFINREKVKYILTLNEVCKYIDSGKTKMFSDEEKLKNKSKLEG